MWVAPLFFFFIGEVGILCSALQKIKWNHGQNLSKENLLMEIQLLSFHLKKFEKQTLIWIDSLKSFLVQDGRWTNKAK